ncbi:MAG: transposase, partial [Caldilineaceae bacterium SB0662_bin_9]|nr:transposase [Caldilineaceae bacterium SB0662_bin_9]
PPTPPLILNHPNPLHPPSPPALGLGHVNTHQAGVGVSRNAVQTWLRWYRAGGLEAVCRRRKGGHGSPSYLTPEQQALLVAEAAQGVFATAQAVQDWLETQFGVVYRVGSLYTLLPRLGIRLKRPRPRHTQADPQAQETWKKGGSGSG